MNDIAKLINELEHILSALNAAYETLAFIDYPRQLDLFNQPPEVVFYDDEGRLVILFKYPHLLERQVLLKNEDWDDLIR